MTQGPTTLELLFARYPLIINLKQLAEIINECPQTIRNKGKAFPIQPLTPPHQPRRYKLLQAAQYLDSLLSRQPLLTRPRGRPTKAVQLQLAMHALTQAESAQTQPFGSEGAHVSGDEADRPMDDEHAECESRGSRTRPSANRGQRPVVGAKRSTIQIDGRASSTDPNGTSMAMPIPAPAGTRRAKAISRVGAPAQHPIWMVERSETTTPTGSARGVQPEQDRLRVQRKVAWRLGLGTDSKNIRTRSYGEPLPCKPHCQPQCDLITNGALRGARRNAS